MIVENLKKIIDENNLGDFFYKNKYLSFDDNAIWTLRNMTHNENPFKFKEEDDNLFIYLTVLEKPTQELLVDKNRVKEANSALKEEIVFINENLESIENVYKKIINHEYDVLENLLKKWSKKESLKKYMDYIANYHVLPFVEDNHVEKIVFYVKKNIEKNGVANDNYGLLFNLLRGLYSNETEIDVSNKLKIVQDAILHTIENNPEFFNEIRQKATYKKLYRDSFSDKEDIEFVNKIEKKLDFFPNKDPVICEELDGKIKVVNNLFFEFYDKFSPRYKKTNFNIILINNILNIIKEETNFKKVFNQFEMVETMHDYFTRNEIIIESKNPEGVKNVMKTLFENMWSKEVVDLMKFNYEPERVSKDFISKMGKLLEDKCREEDLLMQMKSVNKLTSKEKIKVKI